MSYNEDWSYKLTDYSFGNRPMSNNMLLKTAGNLAFHLGSGGANLCSYNNGVMSKCTDVPYSGSGIFEAEFWIEDSRTYLIVSERFDMRILIVALNSQLRPIATEIWRQTASSKTEDYITTFGVDYQYRWLLVSTGSQTSIWDIATIAKPILIDTNQMANGFSRPSSIKRHEFYCYSWPAQCFRVAVDGKLSSVVPPILNSARFVNCYYDVIIFTYSGYFVVLNANDLSIMKTVYIPGSVSYLIRADHIWFMGTDVGDIFTITFNLTSSLAETATILAQSRWNGVFQMLFMDQNYIFVAGQCQSTSNCYFKTFGNFTPPGGYNALFNQSDLLNYGRAGGTLTPLPLDMTEFNGVVLEKPLAVEQNPSRIKEIQYTLGLKPRYFKIEKKINASAWMEMPVGSNFTDTDILNKAIRIMNATWQIKSEYLKFIANNGRGTKIEVSISIRIPEKVYTQPTPTIMAKDVVPEEANTSTTIPIMAGLSGCFVLMICFIIFKLKFTKQNWKGDAKSLHEGTTMTISTTATVVETSHVLAVPGYLEISRPNEKYLLKMPLASGGGGTVDLVRLLDEELCKRNGSETAVLKIGHDARNIAVAARQRLAFQQELSLLHYLNCKSEYFSKLIGFSFHPPMIFLKYYSLGTLKSWLSTADAHNKQDLIKILLGISRAISVMHQEEFAHCDLKPDNILLDCHKNGDIFPVLTDLGISRVLKQELLAKQFPIIEMHGLSVGYAAPEIWSAFRTGQYPGEAKLILAGDIFAFGCIVFECLTKQRPWFQ